MTSKFRYSAAALSLLCTALLSSAAQAETVFVQGNPKGKDVVIKLDSSMAGKTIGVFAAAQGPNYQSVVINVSGSGGEIVSAETYVAVGKEAAAVAVTSGTVPALLYQDGIGNKQIKILKPGESSSSSRSSSSSSSGPRMDYDPNCGCLTSEQKKSFLEQYRIAFPNATEAEFCAILPKGNSCSFDPPSGPGSSSSSSVGQNGARSISASAYLSFNKCLPAGKQGVLVKIDLSGVDPQVLNGGQLTVSTLIRAFSGDKRATVKPKSDGRYSPQPLLLAGPTGGYFYDNKRNVVTMVNWKKKARGKARQLKVVALLYYGGILLEVPLGNNMSGGQGTFEITTGAEGYSFCAKFQRIRQNFNGYKKFG